MKLIDFSDPKETKITIAVLLVLLAFCFILAILTASDSDKLKSIVDRQDKQINDKEINLKVYGDLLDDCWKKQKEQKEQ